MISTGDPMSESQAGDPADGMRGFRRRWATGVAAIAIATGDGGLRGMTATAVMPVSQDPPILALAASTGGEFPSHLQVGVTVGVSILEARQEFWSERFAGRAPVPDRAFTGIGHRLVGGVPVLDGSLAWCVGRIRSIEPAGDHLLVLVDVDSFDVGHDTDDPLLTYEGRYRRLEAG
jgi:flavin reductase (DIM6/NTAB) family NADH-FMN oxidoreductase RutF